MGKCCPRVRFRAVPLLLLTLLLLPTLLNAPKAGAQNIPANIPTDMPANIPTDMPTDIQADMPIPPPGMIPQNPADIPAMPAPALPSVSRIEIASSPNPVGSGARALGMGGAFIGVADDATAASWNPGGLAQLRTPEISFVINAVHRVEDNRFADHPDAIGTETITATKLNYLSAVYPFNLLDRNMVVSLNYQYLYDFQRHWDFNIRIDEDLTVDGVLLDTVVIDSRVMDRKDGGLAAWGLAYCIQILPSLAVGVTANIWNHDLTGGGWESDYRSLETIRSTNFDFSAVSETRIREEYRFGGINFNIGALWRPSPNLTLGMVLKTPFTADLQRERTDSNRVDDEMTLYTRDTSDADMRMPMSYGLGAAFRFSDRLTVSADVYRTHWEDMKIDYAGGDSLSPITGLHPDDSHIDPTIQARVGMEYLILRPDPGYAIPLRWGIFYDPAPAPHSPDDIYGIALGTGLAWGRWVFDIAYQYRYGDDVGEALIVDFDSSQDLSEHQVFTSLIVHF